jgi:Domain of unknown function (DUF4386)
MEEAMNPTRRTAVLVGALFLISTATFIVSNSLIAPILASHDYLSAVAEHSQLVIVSALIALIEGIATVGVAIALYPTLRVQHPSLALGYAGMRIAEVTTAILFALGALLLVTVSTAAPHGQDTVMFGGLLVGLRHWTLMLMYIYTAAGGLMLSFMLLRTKLIPRGLAVLGLVGYVALLTAAVLDILGVVDTVGGVGLVGLIPGGLFEFLLPMWLFAKGFNIVVRNESRVALAA